MTFPEDYFDELKGKTADFKVTLQSVSQVIQPEYTDEFVAKNTEYSSIEEYEEAIREELIGLLRGGEPGGGSFRCSE